jgi:hypothetical protein
VVVSTIASTRVAAAPVSEEAPALRVIPAEPYRPGTALRSVDPAVLPKSAASTGVQYLFGNARLGAALIFRPRDPDTLALFAVAGPSSERCPAWAGMELCRRDFSDLLGRLDKFGFAEFSTLGMTGQGNFDRMGFRTAFQAKGSEWVTLVRVQHPSEKDAIVVILSEGSIQPLLPAFQSACLGKQAKAA